MELLLFRLLTIQLRLLFFLLLAFGDNLIGFFRFHDISEGPGSLLLSSLLFELPLQLDSLESLLFLGLLLLPLAGEDGFLAKSLFI